ncbi:MAG: hypothetical protein EBE86_011230 [Hormoscilla sp. GUM202]|nr:hypothetical protein [Hormoscilla sp. GUM202]
MTIVTETFMGQYLLRFYPDDGWDIQNWTIGEMFDVKQNSTLARRDRSSESSPKRY